MKLNWNNQRSEAISIDIFTQACIITSRVMSLTALPDNIRDKFFWHILDVYNTRLASESEDFL